MARITGVIAGVLAGLNLKAYFFRNDQYVRYDMPQDRADPGYPLPINGNWRMPWTQGFDAATNWNDGKAYFFRGTEYLRYDLLQDKADDGFPKPITAGWHGVWAEGVDAAVKWNDHVAYFFRGNHYIRYDIDNKSAAAGYPKPIAGNWRMPWTDGIDAVVNWGNGKAYFFKGDQYLRYDISADRVDDGYPLSTAEHWPGVLPLTRRTSFDVAKHGFQFPNSFQIDPRKFGVQANSWILGLCGGMCDGAADRWAHNKPIPSLTHPPAQTCPELELFWELFGREMYTLYPAVWAQVLFWQESPDADRDIPNPVNPNFPTHITGLGTWTAQQWPEIKRLIDLGVPAILCIIRESGNGNPSNNHQVLAIGYEMVNPFRVRIPIYDPNHPREEQVLAFDLSDPKNGIHATESDGKPVRGFFLNGSDGRPFIPAKPTPA
ncbi:MAG: hypothetical protein C5B51_29945 [Terriglobia bacterium]|nr:MAG: hypothetical protein C5B51_29945 [Terriglobia bacterium]